MRSLQSFARPFVFVGRLLRGQSPMADAAMKGDKGAIKTLLAAESRRECAAGGRRDRYPVGRLQGRS